MQLLPGDRKLSAGTSGVHIYSKYGFCMQLVIEERRILMGELRRCPLFGGAN